MQNLSVAAQDVAVSLFPKGSSQPVQPRAQQTLFDSVPLVNAIQGSTQMSIPRPVTFSPGITGHPGITPPGPLSANLNTPPPLYDSSSSAPTGPNMAGGPTSMTPPVQPQLYSPYPSLPPIGGNSQGPWLQPPLMTGLSRPPYLHYPAAFSGLLPVPIRGMPPASMPSPNPQPPGTAVGISSAYPGNGSQSCGNLSVESETHPLGSGV